MLQRQQNYGQPAQPLALYSPPPKPPTVWETYRQALLPRPEQPSFVQNAVVTVRQDLECAALAALLGYVHGKTGTLDIGGKYPVDGAIALVLRTLSAFATSESGVSADLKELSRAAGVITMFRKASDFAQSKPKPQATSSGKPNEDPLMAAAEKLGLKTKGK